MASRFFFSAARCAAPLFACGLELTLENGHLTVEPGVRSGQGERAAALVGALALALGDHHGDVVNMHAREVGDAAVVHPEVVEGLDDERLHGVDG